MLRNRLRASGSDVDVASGSTNNGTPSTILEAEQVVVLVVAEAGGACDPVRHDEVSGRAASRSARPRKWRRRRLGRR